MGIRFPTDQKLVPESEWETFLAQIGSQDNTDWTACHYGNLLEHVTSMFIVFVQ